MVVVKSSRSEYNLLIPAHYFILRLDGVLEFFAIQLEALLRSAVDRVIKEAIRLPIICRGKSLTVALDTHQVDDALAPRQNLMR